MKELKNSSQQTTIMATKWYATETNKESHKNTKTVPQ
jgi:hypothetical protein